MLGKGFSELRPSQGPPNSSNGLNFIESIFFIFLEF
jgi:hypothetical protein